MNKIAERAFPKIQIQLQNSLEIHELSNQIYKLTAIKVEWLIAGKLFRTFMKRISKDDKVAKDEQIVLYILEVETIKATLI